MPNFKKLAKKYESNCLASLIELVRKQSVYDESSITDLAPYGKGVKSGLDTLEKFGKEFGFKTRNIDGHAVEISSGEEGPLIGIYAHCDVVPASGKWDYPPFEAKLVGQGKEMKLIGRGTSDDKGPLIASLYSLKLLKDNGLIDGYRVRLVAGGDEERGSSCLDYYFNVAKNPHCDYGFTPDADFPLIYAEKGIVHGSLTKLIDLSPIIAIDGGVAANAVCDKMIVTIPSDKKFIKEFNENKINGDITDTGEIMIVTFKGKSAHGSTPELGQSAIANGFAFLGQYYNNAFLLNLAKAILDNRGVVFNGNSSSKELGEATFNYGIVTYNSKHVLNISVDFRYGEEAKEEEAVANLSKFVDMTFVMNSKAPILLYKKDSPLVSTLMKSYRHMTHRFFDKPMAIGGGTYAKEAKNIVAYGSAFKGHPGNIHSPNEYIYLKDLYAQIAIYADAIYRLGKLKK